MTDTVESVMALAEAIVMAELSGNMKEEARAALRAAVERVIAERNGARNGVTQAAMVNGLLKERAERAEQRNEEQHRLLIKAEAERDALRALLTRIIENPEARIGGDIRAEIIAAMKEWK